MSVFSRKYFHDEAAAFKHIESLLWANGPVCPHCGNDEKIYELKGVRSKPSKKNPEGKERHGLKKCGKCRKQFTVRIGTIFEESHIELHKWLQAIYLMISSKKGISAHQMHRFLEITYKSAWFLCHRIRETMRTGELGPMGGEGQVVEIDETFIGHKKGMPKKRAYHHKHAVLSLVERGGKVRSFHVDKANRQNIIPVVNANIDKESKVMTDEAYHYNKLGNDFESHESVNHNQGEYVCGKVHTNTIEGYFSIFKRGMKGVYQHCDEKHLHRYLAEFDFRYNNRISLGVNDEERFRSALNNIKGKRLTYNS